MWKTFVCDNNQYIIKVVPLENCIQVNLSDLKTIWREELSQENLSNRFKEANQSLGGTEENVKEQIITLINNINEAMKVQIEKKSSSLSLKITSKLDIFNLNFEFLLSRLSEETFYSEVTGPLVRTVRYLEEKELIMRNLLIKKDRELQEYKLEKGNITREDLETKPFDYSSLNSEDNESLMLNIFKGDFWSGVVEKIGDVKIQKNELNNETNTRPVKRKIYSAKTSKKRHHI